MAEVSEQRSLLHFHSQPQRVWSTANTGEAMPGVLTPLGWSLFGPAGERGIRYGFEKIGALARVEAEQPADPAERIIQPFYGRASIDVDFLCAVGARMPGVDGSAVARQILGCVPPVLAKRSSWKRYPVIAARLPVTVATTRRRLAHLAGSTDHRWWRSEVRRASELSLPQATAQFVEAKARFDRAVAEQGLIVISVIQPVFDLLQRLITRAGIGEAGDSLMAGYGSHVESAMIHDLWALSREQMTLEAFLSDHGFHGPREGEISGRVWREDPTPVRSLAAGYGRLGDKQHPDLVGAERIAGREAAEKALLRALPAARRPLAELVMRAAQRYIPLRGVAKGSFLRALDVLRASSRRIGTCLVADQVLTEPDDVFYLTVDELLGGRYPSDIGARINERRLLVAGYRTVSVPNWWQGQPPPTPMDSETDEFTDVLTGSGASAGIVEGVVEVVHDPAFIDVPEDRILVAPLTDPSWASIMYLSKALVVDVGGPLSHAAVVAREIGIPCVIGTQCGTRVLRSGDHVRVDGAAGTVHLLYRSAT